MNTLQRIFSPTLFHRYRITNTQKSKQSGQRVSGAFGGKPANAQRLNDWTRSATEGNRLSKERRLRRLGMIQT